MIHLRDQPGTHDALDDAFATLSAEAEGLTVILHCCSVPPDRICEAIERGLVLLVRRERHLSEVGRPAGDRALGPRGAAARRDGLAVPRAAVRSGKPNQPANVVEVGELLASERGISYAELERIVEANAEGIFRW